MSNVENTALRSSLRAWLYAPERLEEGISDFVLELNTLLNKAGARVFSCSLLVRTLHPRLEMVAWRFKPHQRRRIRISGIQRLVGESEIYNKHGTVLSQLVGHGHAQMPTWKNSPWVYLDERRDSLRAKFFEGRPTPWFPVYDDFMQRNVTDYFAMKLPSRQPFDAMWSFATDRPGGFPPGLCEALTDLATPAGLLVGYRIERLTCAALLSSYVGPRAARAVLSGHVVPGEVEYERAVVGFVQLETSLSESDTTRLDRLHQFFGLVQSKLTQHGGEILKFMTDKLLIHWPIDDQTLAHVAEHATRDCIALMADPQTGLKMSMGLHVGDVVLGTVGAPSRVDFTLLGDTVNRAARLQSFARSHGGGVVMSRELAQVSGLPTQSLGAHSLKGLKSTMEIYAPAI